MHLNAKEYAAMTSDAVRYARIIETRDKQRATELFTEFHNAHKQLTDCLNAFDEADHGYCSTNKLRYHKRRAWERKMRTADKEFVLLRDTVYECLKKMDGVAYAVYNHRIDRSK